MTDSDQSTERPESSAEEKTFRGWRLLGYLAIVVFSLAMVAAVVDWMVLGPLLGRVL
jgi:hypothetical protein